MCDHKLTTSEFVESKGGIETWLCECGEEWTFNLDGIGG